MKDRNDNYEAIAAALTNAFYAGQIKREPFLGVDRRKTQYSSNQSDRTPTISPKEVFDVYQRFLAMLGRESGEDK